MTLRGKGLALVNVKTGSPMEYVFLVSRIRMRTRHLWKVCKNGSISMGNRRRRRNTIEWERERKGFYCTRILYPCQWRRNVVAQLSLLWKSMAAFIPITMASVQRVYIDREIQPFVMSDACLQLLFERVRLIFSLLKRIEIQKNKKWKRYLYTIKRFSRKRKIFKYRRLF